MGRGGGGVEGTTRNWNGIKWPRATLFYPQINLMISVWSVSYTLFELENIKDAWCSLQLCWKQRCSPCRSEGGHSFFLVAGNVSFCLHYKCIVYAWPTNTPNLNNESDTISIVRSIHIYYAPVCPWIETLKQTITSFSYEGLLLKCFLACMQFLWYWNSTTHLNLSTWLFVW